MRQLIYIALGVYALLIWRVYVVAERERLKDRTDRRGKLAQRLENGQ